MVKGFRREYADRIVTARRRVGRFTSIEQFRRETALPVHAIHRLSEADAFASLPRSRRAAAWHTLAISDSPAPLFDHLETESSEPPPLPEMPLGQEVMADYATVGLSLKQHPVALVRDDLKRDGILTAAELNTRARGWVKVAGLVLIRQRPGTASGVVFITLEDETGVVNLIVRPNIYERDRAAARHAQLLQCDGYIERQGQVLHVMARSLHDRSDLLQGYRFQSRDFH